MPIIQRSIPHYSQPQQAVRLSREDGFYYASLAGDKYLEAGILPGISATKLVNQRGIAGELPLLGSQISGPITTVSAGSWSILIDFKPVSKVNLYPYFMGISGAANSFALAWAHDSIAGRAGWYDGATILDSGLTFPIGEQHTLGIAYDDVAKVYSFFKDGVAGATLTGANTGLGNWQFAAAGNEGNTTHISLAAFSNKALSAARMRELTANPWQIYTPRKRQLYVAAASSTPTGTLTQTLGGLSVSSIGAVRIAGTTSSALAPATSEATGKITLTGSASVTLGTATSTSTGAVAITGALSKTLDAATLAATGSLSAPGTGAVNSVLAGATLSADARLSIVGAANVNLGALGLSSASVIRINGALTQSLSNATLSAAGTAPGAALSGSVSVSLGSLTLTAAGQKLWGDVPKTSTVWIDATGASGIWTEI